MRWIRYSTSAGTAYGILEGDRIAEVAGDPFKGYEPTSRRHDLASVNGRMTTRFQTNAVVFGVARFISAMSRYLTLDLVWADPDRTHGWACTRRFRLALARW